MSQQKIKNVLWVFLIIALVIYIFNTNRKGISLEIENDTLVFVYTGEERWEIPIDHIEDIYYTEDFEPGQMVSGVDSRGQIFGVWENASFGEYRLCRFEHIDAYIVLETPTGTVVFNYESADTTRNLYEALK